MNKQEALQVLAKYLPPPVLSEFMKFWWQSGLEAQANGEHFPEAHREAPEAVKAARARARKDDDRQLQYQAFGDAVHEALEHGPQVAASEPQPRWKTCDCSTCAYVRSVLKDGE